MLTTRKKVTVRFNEVDSLRMVWHGHYVAYFEEGREEFGRLNDLDYLGIHKKGFVVPLVKVELEYKKPLRYGDSMIIETTFVNDPAAKLIFDFRILSPDTEEVICKGRTVQVFLDTEGQLMLSIPDFFRDWKIKMGLTESVFNVSPSASD